MSLLIMALCLQTANANVKFNNICKVISIYNYILSIANSSAFKSSMTASHVGLRGKDFLFGAGTGLNGALADLLCLFGSFELSAENSPEDTSAGWLTAPLNVFLFPSSSQ